MKNIQPNLGTIDRAVRIVVGIALLLLLPLAFIGPEVRWALWGPVLGVIPLAAGIVGYCPPYALAGINTCGARTPGMKAGVRAAAGGGA